MGLVGSEMCIRDSATREVLTSDGWLKTGDIGYFDEDGYLYITGRKKFVIVTRGGKNIFPEEIEERLCQSPLIEEALVFSPDDESIQALIYPAAQEVRRRLERVGLDPSDENIWSLLNEEVMKANRALEPSKRIGLFALMKEEFPKTATRKIRREDFRGVSIPPKTKVFRGRPEAA